MNRGVQDPDGENTPGLPEVHEDFGPVSLTATSKAIILDWYRKAKNIRKEKRGRAQSKKVDRRYAERTTRDISDDEGDAEELPVAWAKGGLRLSEATKAIAIKWSKTARARLQKKAAKGGGSENDLFRDLGSVTGFRSGLKSKNERK